MTEADQLPLPGAEHLAVPPTPHHKAIVLQLAGEELFSLSSAILVTLTL